jgi:hypothetical protein
VATILRSGPIATTQRVACLNDNPAFIDYLALRVEEALAGGDDARPGARSCSRCPRAV